MAEMNKITSFKTFTQLRAEESAAKLAEERTARRSELVNKLASVLDEMDIATFDELDEEKMDSFITKAFGDVSEEETVEEGNAFIYAASKAKAEGKDEFEFNGKTYKVTLKADTGLRESEEISEARIKMNNFDWGKTTAERNANLDKYDSLKTDKEKEEFLKSLKNESVLNEAKLNKKDTAEIAQKIADIFTRESADEKEFFKYVVSDGVSPMSFDLDVEKTAKTPKKLADEPNYFGEYAGGSFVIKDEGDCWCVYNAAMGMAHIEKFNKADLSLVESVSEAIIVTGKRDAKRVMNTYIKFFEKYPALGPNAMGVPAIHHLGAIKELYSEAMIDANFSRELPATKNAIKGRLYPIDVKIADLNNATVRVSVGKLTSICEQNGSIISGAAKFSGLAIVEGTAMYLDLLNHGKYAEDLLAKFNATFESVEVMEARLAEGNAFSTARLKAIEAGKDEFEFDGKTYPLKSVDKEDKELADELVGEGETLDDYNNALEMSQKYAIPIATAMATVASVGVASAITLFKKGKKAVSKWADKNLDESFVLESSKEEQVAMEIYTEVAGPDGKYSENELAKADMDLYMDIVTAAGHKGGKAKKIADEFRKIATMESLVSENYEVIFSDGMSQMKKFRSEKQAVDFMHKEIKSNKKLRDIAVYKPGMHSTTQTELVVAFWGNGSYLDNVSKRDSDLAAKKVEESTVFEANRSEIHKAAKKGSYPVTIVITNKGGSFDGKVAHQETVETPAAVPAAMKVLYKKYATWGHTFAIEDSTGKVLFQESVEVNEAEVKSDEEFSEYAMTVLKQAFGEDFDEAKAQEVIDGLTSKHSGDYGAMIGALQSSLG